MDKVATVIMTIGVIAVVFTWILVAIAHWHLHRQKRLLDTFVSQGVSFDLPSISILKPIRGVDDGLLENLSALVSQDYPAFEILIGIKDPLDPAHQVVAQLRQAYPTFPIRVLTGFEDIGLNPKVNSLYALFHEATYPLCLISDADVYPHPDYLRRLVTGYLVHDAKLAHSVLLGYGARTLGAWLDNLQINSFVAVTQLALDAVKHPTVVGKSMLFAKADLERIGGWAVVKDTLNEDYAIGRRMDRAGMRVYLCPDVLRVREPRRTYKAFLNRHVRWAQMRRACRPDGYVLELLLNPTAWGVLLCFLACLTPTRMCTLFTQGLSLIAAKVLADMALYRSLSGQWLDVKHLPLITVKDLSMMAFWMVGLVHWRVTWRDRQFRLTRGAQLAPLTKP